MTCVPSRSPKTAPWCKYCLRREGNSDCRPIFWILPRSYRSTLRRRGYQRACGSTSRRLSAFRRHLGRRTGRKTPPPDMEPFCEGRKPRRAGIDIPSGTLSTNSPAHIRDAGSEEGLNQKLPMSCSGTCTRRRENLQLSLEIAGDTHPRASH